MHQAGFVADTLTYDATLRNLELIGEAATHIPSEVREAHSEIQWRDIIATRNRLAHGYLGIDNDVIWDIIQNDVPKLLPALRNLLNTTSSESGFQTDLFADFNGLPSEDAKTEFYQHDANWSNRMILGDSLQVMASLAEREGLRGKVQCIYIDPPYGIKFNSNFQ